MTYGNESLLCFNYLFRNQTKTKHLMTILNQRDGFLIIKFTSTLIIRRVKKMCFFSWNSACVGLAWEELHLPLIRAEGLKKSQWSPAFLSSHMIYHNQTDAQWVVIASRDLQLPAIVMTRFRKKSGATDVGQRDASLTCGFAGSEVLRALGHAELFCCSAELPLVSSDWLSQGHTRI